MDGKLLMETGFVCDKALMAAAMLRPEIKDMLCKK
jgi:hypothetical protein